MSRILIVEDQRDLAEGLRSNLVLEGYAVTLCHNGAEALATARDCAPDLIILDLMLPERNGFEILLDLRQAGLSCAVLCLTARGEELDKVRALRSGADDYVTKPFGLMELLARVEAMLRRTPGAEAAADYRFGDVRVDCLACRVTRNNRPVPLTPKEYALLLALLRADGAAVSRLELMKRAWGHRAAVISRTVDTHVAELRRKLESSPRAPKHIITVHKVGYRLER